ncbi:CCA tRNA nucleotidyltransferase [Pararhodobacter sp. SW119]|uniref:CCA tRNA nucleotidyltransferase n=1 Tax=Pararhodobacter sp. SW119 TaxID=2780075 RepID=UPI001ADF4BED|nr:CCA tRNA nucleotidyltransferase [Pararhodobacter sp. SW119]
MKVSGDWLTCAGTQAVLGMLARAGYQAFCVGGCVRNALLGAPVTDVDIATNALPATVLHMAGLAGLKAVPTGYAHGTVTIVVDGTGYEVTTFRHDVETFGRHARVAFATDLAQDAARRDFTMNALYARADGTVVDPLGGLADLQARRIRFVGDPHARIAEDCLRILRFFRFHAQYGDPEGGLDPQALAACAAHVDMLAGLSRERVGAEMRKLLAAPDPAPAVAAMEVIGVLAALLPGAAAGPLSRLIALEGGAPGDWLRRLATLGGPDPSQALRLSRAEARDLARLHAAIQGDDRPAALGYRLGRALGTDALLARAATQGTPLPDGWRADLDRGAASVFPLRPADLTPALSGPPLGAALKRAEAHWIAQDFAPDRAALRALVLGD